MFAAANYRLYGSYQKAQDGKGIHRNTLKQRVAYLKRDYPDQYDNLDKMSKKELNEVIITFSKEDTNH